MLLTSIEPEEEGLVVGRGLRLEEPVEERPAVPLVDGDVAGELRDPGARRLPGQAGHPVGLLLVADAAASGVGGAEDDEEDGTDERRHRCHLCRAKGERLLLPNRWFSMGVKCEDGGMEPSPWRVGRRSEDSVAHLGNIRVWGTCSLDWCA